MAPRAVVVGPLVLALQATGQHSYSPSCATVPSLSGGSVKKISDGKNDRCIAIIAPENAKKPMPVLFWFHGSGGTAAHCGSGPLGKIAEEKGFALVCGEAISGKWDIPRVITDSTGTPCKDTDSVDVPYMENAIAELAKDNSTFDTSRVFTSGCSMGSAFSIYSSSCIKAKTPEIISAFATHSTGLKVKGDGNRFPENWGECDGCQYFPFAPTAFKDSLGLKACVFDNTGDSPFYASSQALAKRWKALGMKTYTNYQSGGHCQIHSYDDIVNCLDDGSKRLLPGGSPPSPPPSPSPPGPRPPSPRPPSPGPSPSPGGDPPAACQKCFEDKCPNLKQESSQECQDCLKKNMGQCAKDCMPYPFNKALSWFCKGGNKTVEDVIV